MTSWILASRIIQMTISLERAVRSTSCLILVQGFRGRWIEWSNFRLHRMRDGGRPPSWKFRMTISQEQLIRPHKSYQLMRTAAARSLMETIFFLFQNIKIYAVINNKASVSAVPPTRALPLDPTGVLPSPRPSRPPFAHSIRHCVQMLVYPCVRVCLPVWHTALD